MSCMRWDVGARANAARVRRSLEEMVLRVGTNNAHGVLRSRNCGM